MRKHRGRRSRKSPAKKSAVDKVYNDFVAALENLYELFDTLRENQDLLSEKVDRLNQSFEALDRRLGLLEVKVSQVAEDVDDIKHEIRLIRHDLTQKVNREEFEILAERVEKLEKELAVR